MGRQPLTPPPRNDLFRVCRRTYERRVLTSGPGRLRVYYNSSIGMRIGGVSPFEKSNIDI